MSERISASPEVLNLCQDLLSPVIQSPDLLPSNSMLTAYFAYGFAAALLCSGVISLLSVFINRNRGGAL